MTRRSASEAAIAAEQQSAIHSQMIEIKPISVLLYDDASEPLLSSTSYTMHCIARVLREGRLPVQQQGLGDCMYLLATVSPSAIVVQTKSCLRDSECRRGR